MNIELFKFHTFTPWADFGWALLILIQTFDICRDYTELSAAWEIFRLRQTILRNITSLLRHKYNSDDKKFDSITVVINISKHLPCRKKIC